MSIRITIKNVYCFYQCLHNIKDEIKLRYDYWIFKKDDVFIECFGLKAKGWEPFKMSILNQFLEYKFEAEPEEFYVIENGKETNEREEGICMRGILPKFELQLYFIVKESSNIKKLEIILDKPYTKMVVKCEYNDESRSNEEFAIEELL